MTLPSKPSPHELGVAGVVRSTWERVLGRPVEWGDDFFDLGGDSLTALTVAVDIAQATGLVVPTGWLYRHPRIADAVRALLRSPAASISAPIPLPRQGRHPVSFQQEGLLAVMRHIGGEHRYQVAYAVALDARVDVGRLRAAAERMPDRHPALATRLVRCGDALVQDVHTVLPPLLEDVVAGGAPVDEVMDRWASAAIVLDGPLARTGLVQGAGERRFVLAAHQMVMDPWSWGLLLRDLAVLYAEPDARDAPRLSYSDYARWQHTHLTGQTYARHLDFWQQAADGSPAGGVGLPGAPSGIAPAGPAARLPLQVPGEVVAELEERSRVMGASLFEALLALFQLAVGRWAGTDDVLVASATASRTAPGTEDVAGFFVNGRFTRTRITAGTTADLVEQVKHSWRAAEEHRELHLEKTLFDLGRPDMANVKFSLNTIPGLVHLPALGGRKLRTVPVTGAASARRHVSVGLTRVEGGLAGALTYRTDLLTQDAVADLISDLDQLLRAFAADPDQPIALAHR
ncbi:condensation domain-containing protein [Streptomyces nigrescens]|uniref:condensation domain-containing protein n=1 Tax=Streptomyces nigrescens TaxID=1920 RepID=UPI003702C2A8